MDFSLHRITPYTPSSPAHCRAIEAWLEERAREGLILQEQGSLFSHFQRGTRCHRRYRIEQKARLGAVNAQRRLLLREAGWQYLGFSQGFSYYCSADMEQQSLPPWPENPQKPQKPQGTQASFPRDFILITLCLAGILWIFYERFFHTPDAQFDFLTLSWSRACSELVLLLPAVLALICVLPLFLYRRLRWRTAPPFVHSEALAQREARRKCIVHLMCFALSFLLLILSVVTLPQSKSYSSLPLSAETSLPFPQIATLSPVEGAALTQHLGSQLENPSFESTLNVLYPKGPFLLKNLWLFQQVPDVFQYQVRSYEMRRLSLANRLLLCLREDLSIAYEALPAPDGSSAYFGEWESTQFLLLQIDCTVFVISYSGVLDLQEQLPLFTSQLLAA